MIHLIVCTGEGGEIGKNNDMPWGRGLPEDLKYFKRVTNGYDVIMGRKTFDSILTSLGKPLPERKNIVLTRDKDFHYEGVHVYHTIEEFLNEIKKETNVFVIGGASIYQQFLPFADSLYITKIHEAFDADTYFPLVNEEEWEEVSSEKGIKNEENPFDYDYFVYKRKNS